MTNLLETINNQINRNIYHGASLTLFKDGQWSEHYIGTIDGVAPVKSGLICDLASVSKVIGVETVIILLLYQGKLELDAPLMRYYPDFHESSVTLRRLLAHSSGIDPFTPNRGDLNVTKLKETINHITMENKKESFYIDINLLLLGFMLEEVYGKSPDVVFKDKVFQPFGMTNTGFDPVKNTVSTAAGIGGGLARGPKAEVLGIHFGSAGLSSNLQDLKKFCQRYLTGDFMSDIWRSFSQTGREYSLAQDKEDDQLDHASYTGTYVIISRKKQKATIFLINRTYTCDDRLLWIEERQRISQWIQQNY